METARCLLIQAGLPAMFWAEAVNTANYIRNRCPSKAINGKTPFEMWTGRVPKVKHLRNFGDRVLCLDNRQGKSKLQKKTKEGIFLGYSNESKGYRVWIPETKSLITSRDVKFFGSSKNGEFEDFFPTQESSEDSKQITPHVVEVEIFSPTESAKPADLSQENEDETNSKRGRGRPRLRRTGQRGRPTKRYQEAQERVANVDETTEVFLAEVSLKEALSGPDCDEWNQAMASEITSILKNDTWQLVDRPKNCQTVGSRMILRNKFNADGKIERRKARLVAQGFSQKPGIHFHETFAPVTRLSSIRLLTSIATRMGMELQQFDIASAYLNGELKEIIYMEVPKQLQNALKLIHDIEGISVLGQKADKMLKELRSGNKVCLLKKALYGLRQAGKSWHTKLDQILKKYGATPTTADPCLYYVVDGGELTLIAVYVDDIMIASKSRDRIDNFEKELSKFFEVKDLGPVQYCLGLEFTRSGKNISIHQKAYVEEILKKFGMEDCKPVSTPADPGLKLTKPEGQPTTEELKLPYRELVGALTYLSTATRPDISFSVSCLSQFNNCYRQVHWKAAKRVLRYLKGTKDLGLTYGSDKKSVQGYVDADWGNCSNDRRSYTGYVFIFNGGPVSWDSKKQRTVALSTTEAEYMGLSEVAKEAIYLRGLLSELGLEEAMDITVYNDNMSAIKLSKNPGFHGRTKHIDIRHHFVRECVERKVLSVQHMATDKMPADILTKGLSRLKHNLCVKVLGLGKG